MFSFLISRFFERITIVTIEWANGQTEEQYNGKKVSAHLVHTKFV